MIMAGGTESERGTSVVSCLPWRKKGTGRSWLVKIGKWIVPRCRGGCWTSSCSYCKWTRRRSCSGTNRGKSGERRRRSCANGTSRPVLGMMVNGWRRSLSNGAGDSGNSAFSNRHGGKRATRKPEE